MNSPLAKVRKPAGRVDLLIARLLEEAATRAGNPLLAAAYQEVKPAVETLLARKLGPRTRRGKKIAADLFLLRNALQNYRRPAA